MSEGGGGVMVVAVCGEVSEGQNTTGSLGPPPPPLLLLFLLLLLLLLITHTNAREEDPLDCCISALILLLHHPSILPSFLFILAAAALLSCRENSAKNRDNSVTLVSRFNMDQLTPVNRSNQKMSAA